MKQKSISFYKTLNNLLTRVLVHKVEKSTVKIEAAVVRVFILSIHLINGWLFKGVQEVLIFQKFCNWSLQLLAWWLKVTSRYEVRICFLSFIRNLNRFRSFVCLSIMFFSLIVFIVSKVLLLLLLLIVTPKSFIAVQIICRR